MILAQDGEEGLRAFTEHIHEIDLILADVAMPKMDGIELVRRILTQKPGAKVVLMTGPSTVIPADLRQICSLLEKPFVFRRLLAAVGNCLRAAESALTS